MNDATTSTPGSAEPEPPFSPNPGGEGRAPAWPDDLSPGPPPEDRGGVKARVLAVRERAEGYRRRVEEARPRVPAIDAAFQTQESDRRFGGSLLAGAMAFRLFLFILPVALLLVGVFGLFTRLDVDVASDVARTVSLSPYLVRAIAQSAEASSTGSWVAIFIGLFAGYFAAAGAAKALWLIHQLAWRLPVQPLRRTWKAALIFTAFAVGASAVTAAVAHLRAVEPGPGLVMQFLMIFAFGGVWLWASTMLPHADAPWTALIPGALFVSAGAEIVHLVTVLYLSRRLESSSAVYGTLGVAAVLLFWLYLIGRLMVASAVLNATLWRRKHPQAPPPDDGVSAA
jgi:uncharacterized BrkB/YihY/UPF0761 family membrane protein